LNRRIGRALQETAPLWPNIKRAFGWVHRAAHILNNTEVSLLSDDGPLC
jgi:hypothetical protein